MEHEDYKNMLSKRNKLDKNWTECKVHLIMMTNDIYLMMKLKLFLSFFEKWWLDDCFWNESSLQIKAFIILTHI